MINQKCNSISHQQKPEDVAMVIFVADHKKSFGLCERGMEFKEFKFIFQLSTFSIHVIIFFSSAGAALMKGLRGSELFTQRTDPSPPRIKVVQNRHHILREVEIIIL